MSLNITAKIEIDILCKESLSTKAISRISRNQCSCFTSPFWVIPLRGHLLNDSRFHNSSAFSRLCWFFFFLFYLIPSHCEVTNPYAISKFSLSLSFICVEILLQLAAFHIAISLAVVSQSISRLA